MEKLLSRVIIVGAGRVGTLFGTLIQELSGSLSLLTTQSTVRASELRTQFPSVSVSCWSSSEKVPNDIAQDIAGDPSLLLITVRDDSLPATVSALVSQRASWSGWTVVHCSGATPLELLSPFGGRGAETAVMHPCYPITAMEKIESADRAQMTWTIEASSARLGKLLESMVRRWGAQPVTLGEVNRTLYHASQVLGAGHVVTLYALVERLLIESNLSAEQARLIVCSLLSGIDRNVRDCAGSGLETIITGPFVRGDRAVIEQHLSMLKSVDLEASDVYQLLGKIASRLS